MTSCVTDPNGCIDAFTCGAGSDPTTGGGGTGSGTGGTVVAVQTPAPGAPCRGSDSAGVTLDDQLPLGSTGTQNDVINMSYLYEPSTLSGNGQVGGQVIVGWIAMTPTNYFIISNGRDGNMVHNLAQQIPVLGQVWNTVANTQAMAISPSLNAAQVGQIFKDYPANAKSGNGSAPCFTGALPQSQWT